MYPNSDGGLTIPWGATAVDFSPTDALMDSRFGEALVEFARSLLLEGPDDPDPKVLVAVLLHTLPLKVGLAMWEDLEASLVGATDEIWQDRFATAESVQDKLTVIAGRYMQSGAGVLKMERLQEQWRTELSEDGTLPGRDTENMRLLYDELELAAETGVVTLEKFSSVQGLTRAMVEHQQAIQRAGNPVVISNDEWSRLVALTREKNPDPVIDYIFHRRPPTGDEGETPEKDRPALWAQQKQAQAHRAAELGQTYLEYRIPAIGDMSMESVIDLRHRLTDELERFRECLLNISASAPLASDSDPGDRERFFSQARGELERRERELVRLVEQARLTAVARRSAPKLTRLYGPLPSWRSGAMRSNRISPRRCVRRVRPNAAGPRSARCSVCRNKQPSGNTGRKSPRRQAVISAPDRVSLDRRALCPHSISGAFTY
jgi:hypothetical protein